MQNSILKNILLPMATLVALLLLVPIAKANDSTAVLAAGGLRLEKSQELAILSEKLRISPTRIVVDYEIQNISKAPVETLIVFPLPILEGPMLVNTPVDINAKQPENFLDFSTSVNGQVVETKKQVKAFQIMENGGFGQDVTAELLSAEVLISPLDRGFYDRIADLPRETQQKLSDLKLLDIFEHDKERNYTPLWAVEYSYYSKQKFEPGKTVHIHHEYTPIAGKSLFGEFSFKDDLSRWCIDAATQKGIHSMIEKRPVTAGWEKILELKQVDYILKTGANWAGPIRLFELIIEKENPKQIVSLCMSGLKKISDKEFQLSLRDFTPKDDLSILFFEPTVSGR